MWHDLCFGFPLGHPERPLWRHWFNYTHIFEESNRLYSLMGMN